MVPRANCDGDDVRKLPDESPNFPRLFLRGLDLEHIEQITGNTDEVVPWRLFDQPTKPINAEVKIGGQEKFHLWRRERLGLFRLKTVG